jgi:hypothetical protein
VGAGTIRDMVDHFKLDVKFRTDCVVQSTRWIREKTLGYGSFSEVWLERSQEGSARAVKVIRKSSMYHIRRELISFAALSKVR